jgi:FkbM family methyltransferase
MEIDGIKFYYSRGNEPQNPKEMGRIREMYQTLDNGAGELAIDVGAHIGSYTLRMAKRFRQVIAFEPNPFNRHILGLNVQLNKATNVQVEDAALSDRDEISSFFLHRAADGTGSLNPHHYGFKYDRTIRVKSKRLDSFDFSRIDLLKIDAEGNELPILKGAANTIARTKPTLAIEVHQARTALDNPCNCETCAYLQSKNYDVETIGEYTVTPVHWIIARPAK